MNKFKVTISFRQLFALGVLAALLGAGVLTGFNFSAAQAQLAFAAQPLANLTDPSVATDELNNVEVYRAMSPGVVFITSSSAGGRGLFDYRERRGAGSGSVIDKQGHILTNEHVVARAGRITVSLGGERTYTARVVGRDPDTDLAVIKIDAPASELTVVPFGDSESLAVGQKVLAIGNPFGLDRTLTTGVISGLQRPLRGTNNRLIEGAIQTDASINPGNSGGPLLDSRGRLIGINSQILSSSGGSNGIGFAVPVNIAKRVVPQLIRSGYVTRPRLGVTTRSLRSFDGQAALPATGGILVFDVAPGSAAATAGLRPTRQGANGEVVLGDIIVSLDGEGVDDNGDLSRILDRREVGDTVRVEIVRDRSRLTLPVRLLAAPRE